MAAGRLGTTVPGGGSLSQDQAVLDRAGYAANLGRLKG